MVVMQRFCPFCDRAFVEGEAILVCEGCGVMHHPSCWVRNNGCSTSDDHDVKSVARAYQSTGHVAPSPLQPSESMRPQRGNESTGRGTEPLSRAEDGTVIGAPVSAPPRDGIDALNLGNSAVPGPFQPPPRPHAHDEASQSRDPGAPRLASRPLEPPGAPVRHGRYVPPEEEFVAIRKPMPGIYKERRWLQYWYLPVAGLIALLVAGGVVYGANLLFGGGDDDDGEDVPAVVDASPTVATSATTEVETPGATAEATTEPGETPGAEMTAGATAIPTGPPTGGRFEIADILVVTGAGDCLNVRVGPDRLQPAIVCLKDGSEVAVTGGPQQADSFTWWQVVTPLGEGWAVEDFLREKP